MYVSRSEEDNYQSYVREKRAKQVSDLEEMEASQKKEIESLQAEFKTKASALAEDYKVQLSKLDEGYKKELELVGVGFKAANTGNVLDLALGYSHNIIFEIPKELTVTTTTEKGQNPKIFLESADKQLIGQVAAKIRGLRKPEPYKGKGVRYSDEVVRRKAGKAAGK